MVKRNYNTYLNCHDVDNMRLALAEYLDFTTADNKGVIFHDDIKFLLKYHEDKYLDDDIFTFIVTLFKKTYNIFIMSIIKNDIEIIENIKKLLRLEISPWDFSDYMDKIFYEK